MVVDMNDFDTWMHTLGSEPTYRPPPGRVAQYQLIIALILGGSAFLIFCLLRVKYPKIYVANFTNFNNNYLHSFGRQNLPKLPSKSIFGWIPILFRIDEDQILQHAGLDAVVFLGVFKMALKVITICLLFAFTIISPIRYKFTGRYDQDDPDPQDPNASIFRKPVDESGFQKYLWMYTVFTYVFTGIVSYFLFQQTIKIIKMRQTYLGQQNSITDKTIKLSGIPPILRDEEDLKRHIERFDIGEIDSIVIVREWNELNKLFKIRKRILRQAEIYWVEYLRNCGIKNKTDLLSSNLYPNLGDSVNLNFEFESQNFHSREGSPESRVSIIEQITEIVTSPRSSHTQLPLLNDESNKRPYIRKGWFGKFGPKVDAINYYTAKLEVVDKEIIRARNREYPASTTAFITMKSVAQAQMLAQAVLDPQINHLITTLAPAPHDINWDSVCLTRRERNTRIFIVTLVIGILSVILVYPVIYIANFLNIKTISKVIPQLGELLKNHKWAATLVTGLLPTYLFTLLNVIMPYVYIWITELQGFTSHSDEELSAVSKNFFYIFVNLFLVFTLFGTVSLTDTLSDTTKIAYALAKSLSDLSSFYIDLIILQGIGMFPYKLLLLGNLLKFPIGNMFWCKTPRDYLNLYKPPVFNFGLQLPQPILIFIITLVYSIMSTKILTAGLIYFFIGYFVYKYQLLYACVHPPHSTGKVWPLVFRRIILGLFLFQITMAGSLALQKAYICATFLAPLPIATMYCLYNFQTNYIPLSIFIALRSIENDQTAPADDESRIQTLDERRELNTTYQFPNLIKSLDGPLIAVDNNEVLLMQNDGIMVRKERN